MSTLSFPTPLVNSLWEQSGQMRAALAVLTTSGPFEARPEWILPYLSEDGIDFDALRYHAFASREEDALVAIAASLYGYWIDGGPAAVRLGEAMQSLTRYSFVAVVFAMQMAGDFPVEYLTNGGPFAPRHAQAPRPQRARAKARRGRGRRSR